MLLYLLSPIRSAPSWPGSATRSTRGQLAASVEYYLARTSHGSSLSGVVHSWLQVNAGREPSWPLVKAALAGDLARNEHPCTV